MSSPRPMILKSNVVVVLMSLAWVVVVGAGAASIHWYERTPGTQLSGPDRWPDRSAIPLCRENFTVVMFAHPRCPCTKSSLEELKALRACLPGQFQVRFWVPEHASSEWTESALWRQAEAIPNVAVTADVNGSEAKRFAATTSGHVVVFRADGSRVYSGGLTAGRGQPGHGLSVSRIREMVKDRDQESTELPVFGCSLFNRVQQCEVGNQSWQE